MKKICFVTTVPITIKSFLVGLTDYLIKEQDYDVTFICNDDDVLRDMCNERLHFIPVGMKRGVGFDGLSVINKMTKIFKEQKFDIVQYATPNASLYASIAAARANVPCRLYTQWGIRYMGFTGLPRFIFKSIEKLICTKSTIIEVESFSLMDFSIKEKLYAPTKASVIWNGSACGVNLKKFDYSQRETLRKQIREELGIAEDEIVFGYAGRITRDKGINELVDAFVGIKGLQKARLLLIGDYDNAGTMREDVVSQIESNPRIKHVGWAKNVERYYAAMDAFCSLSYREGFGLVVIEAGAIGTPGIVSNVPGQLDTLIDGKTGILAEVKNVESIRKAIEKYINNPNLSKALGDNAHKHIAESYDDRTLFEKLAEHRNELVERNNHA